VMRSLYLLTHTHPNPHNCIIWLFYNGRCGLCDTVPWGTWETYGNTSASTNTPIITCSTYSDDPTSLDSDSGDDNASWESSNSGQYHPPLVLPYPSSDTLAIIHTWWQDHMWLIVNCIFYNDYKYHPLDIEHWLGIHGHSMTDPTDTDFLTQCTTRMQSLLDAFYMDASDCDPEYTICYGHVRELMTEFHFQLLRMHYLLTHPWPQTCPPDLSHNAPHCLPFSTPHTPSLTYTNIWPRKCSDYNGRVYKDLYSPNADIFNFTEHPNDLRLTIQSLHAPDITCASPKPSVFEYLCTPAFRAAGERFESGDSDSSSLSPSAKADAAAAPALAILSQLYDPSYLDKSTHSWSISTYSRADSDDDWDSFGGSDSDDIYRRQARGILGVQKDISYTTSHTHVLSSLTSSTLHNTHYYTRDGELLLYARMISCERYHSQFQLMSSKPHCPSPTLQLHNHSYKPSLTPIVKYRGPRHYSRHHSGGGYESSTTPAPLFIPPRHYSSLSRPLFVIQSSPRLNRHTRGLTHARQHRRRLTLLPGTASPRDSSHTFLHFSRQIHPLPSLKRNFLPSRTTYTMRPHEKLSSHPPHLRKHSLTYPFYSLWLILILLTSHLFQPFCYRSLSTRMIATHSILYNIVPTRNHSTPVPLPFVLYMHSLPHLVCTHFHTYKHVSLLSFLPACPPLATVSSSLALFSLPPCYNPRRQSQWLRSLFEYVLYYPP